MHLSRSVFLKQASVLGISGLLMGNLKAFGLGVSPNNLIPKKRMLRIAHLTDVHVKPELVSEKGFAKALNAVNDLKDKPDFIINGGDAIMNSVFAGKDLVKKQWQSYHSVMKNENALPVYNCIGNHDVFGWLSPSSSHEEGKHWAKDEFGLNKSYYSFEKNNWKIIVLDSIHARKSIPGYVAKLDDEQLEWLIKELVNTPKNQYVCIVSHIPILSICTFFDGSTAHHNKMNVSDTCMHTDAAVLKNLFHQYPNVTTCISGHIHLVDQLSYLGTEYYCNGAVSGAWWEGAYKEFAPAFAIMNLYSDGTSDREMVYYNWQ